MWLKCVVGLALLGVGRCQDFLSRFGDETVDARAARLVLSDHFQDTPLRPRICFKFSQSPKLVGSAFSCPRRGRRTTANLRHNKRCRPPTRRTYTVKGLPEGAASESKNSLNSLTACLR